MYHTGMNERENSRRRFIRSLPLGVAGIAAGTSLLTGSASGVTNTPGKSRVTFVTGADRRDMVCQTLKPLEKEIRKGIGDRQVIIKPNNVYDSTPLCATHPDAMRGVLDFLKPFYKKQVIIAESTTSPKGTLTTFEQYKYLPLGQEYNVTFVDLTRSLTRRSTGYSTRPITRWASGSSILSSIPMHTSYR